MVFSIRLTAQEKKIVESYARMHSISLVEAFKQDYLKKLKISMIILYVKKHSKNMKRVEERADR